MIKTLLIINPCAGKRKIKYELMDVISVLNNSGRNVTVAITQNRSHATQIVKQYDNYDEIICSGGDGTINEVISGLLSSNKKTPLGYIPAGSTNDFANSLGLSSTSIQAVNNIINGKKVPLDIGMFNNKYFSYVASFGAFTQASYTTPQNLKNSLGHFAYLLEGTKYLPSIATTVHAKISTDEGDIFEGDYIFGSITNSTTIGGLINFRQDIVDMSDGKFEIFLIKLPTDLIQFNQCIKAINTKKYEISDLITFKSAKEFYIETDGSFPWTLDGEKEEGSKNIHIVNINHAINIIK